MRNRPTPTQVPANPDYGTSVTVPDAKTQEITHLVSNPSISSSKQQTQQASKLASSVVSQKTSVVTKKRLFKKSVTSGQKAKQVSLSESEKK